MKAKSTLYSLLTLLLRAGLVLALFAGGWLIYRELPSPPAGATQASNNETTVQIFLRPSAALGAGALDITVDFYPVDVVAVRNEYFTERRAGKRFDDFLSERMDGRKTVTVKLDQQGQALAILKTGNWWIHAQMDAEEELEWRLPVSVGGHKQIVELSSQNVYTRARSF